MDEIENFINKLIEFRDFITAEYKNKDFKWEIDNSIDINTSLFSLSSSVEFELNDIKKMNIIKYFRTHIAPYYKILKIFNTYHIGIFYNIDISNENNKNNIIIYIGHYCSKQLEYYQKLNIFLEKKYIKQNNE